LHEAALGLAQGMEPPALDASKQRVRAAGVLLEHANDPVAWAAEHLADGLKHPVYSI
jgi:phthalate 4,5-dioxygenase